MVEAIFGLIGVVVGSALTIAKDSVVAWKRRREDASYSAIRLILILDQYADLCVDVVLDDGTSYGRPAGRTDSGEEYYLPQVNLPPFPEYPDEIAWRSLPISMTNQILSLPNKAKNTDSYIIFLCKNYGFPPDEYIFFEARQKGYADLGIDALTLADQLAKQYQFETTHKPDLGFDWDRMAVLRDKVAEIEKRRKKREPRSEDF